MAQSMLLPTGDYLFVRMFLCAVSDSSKSRQQHVVHEGETYGTFERLFEGKSHQNSTVSLLCEYKKLSWFVFELPEKDTFETVVQY